LQGVGLYSLLYIVGSGVIGSVYLCVYVRDEICCSGTQLFYETIRSFNSSVFAFVFVSVAYITTL
jgi:hypothetical protein